MAKEPVPGSYVPPHTAIDEHDCVENQRRCRKELDGIFERIFKAIEETVTWGRLSIMVGIIAGILGIVYYKSEAQADRIALLERTDVEAKGERMVLSEIVRRAEAALTAQAAAFDALRKELRNSAPYGPKGGSE